MSALVRLAGLVAVESPQPKAPPDDGPSQLEMHAEDELRRAGLFDKDSDYDGMMGPAVMKLVKAMSGQGHSGMSAMMALDIFGRLARYQPLTPLTDDASEWMDVTNGLWQSRRNPEAFSKDGGRTYTLLGTGKKVHRSEKRSAAA